MTKKKMWPFALFIILLIGMAFFPYIPLRIFNINLDNMSPGFKVLYNFICDIGFMAIIFFVYKKEIIDNFKSYFEDFKNNFNFAFKHYIVGLTIMMVSNTVIALIFSQATASNEEAVRSLIGLYPVYMFFSVSIYAPYVEEIIFRKCIRDMFYTFGNNKIIKFLYILTSGLIFSAMHVVGAAEAPIDYIYIIPYLSLGIVFATLYTKTDNIFSSISMHALHNASAIVLYFIAGVV